VTFTGDAKTHAFVVASCSILSHRVVGTVLGEGQVPYTTIADGSSVRSRRDEPEEPNERMRQMGVGPGDPRAAKPTPGAFFSRSSLVGGFALPSSERAPRCTPCPRGSRDLPNVAQKKAIRKPPGSMPADAAASPA
jgi:hypothetical protein